MKKNKAQISIFVIIAVILLVVMIFLLVNNKIDIFTPTSTKYKNQISEVVENCVQESGERGVFLLGFQGGYIEVPDQIAKNPKRVLDFGLPIPTWDTSRNDIPTINSMQEELNNFVVDESLACIRSGFKSYDNIFKITYDEEKFKVTTEINDQNVNFESYLPVKFKATNDEKEFSVETYFTNLEAVRLGDLYKLATQIYSVESQRYVFEELIMDQIYSASAYSSKDSMPSEGMSISCAQQIWTKTRLKENLANLNNNNFKYLQFVGTYPKTETFEINLNKELGTENLKQYFEKQYRYNLPQSKSSFKNYDVEIMMPSTQVTGKSSYFNRYPFREFDITPSSGELVRSQLLKIDVGAEIPIPCIQYYHHLYTLDYDLLIKLKDYNEDSNGYFFQFPLRVEIYNNQPKVKPAQNFPISEPLTANNEVYCADENKEFPIQVYAKDASSGDYLNDVNISYKCLQLSCDLGQTVKPYFRGFERTNALPSLETKFPFCVNGRVKANLPGYFQLPNEELLTADNSVLGRDISFQYEVELAQTKKFDITLSSFLAVFENGKGYRTGKEEDGMFFISIENKALGFSSDAMWPHEGIEEVSTLEFIDKGDVSYNVSVIFTGPEGGLQGLLELKDWKPNIHSGNELRITVPAISQEITEDIYEKTFAYFEQIKTVEPFGINFK